MKSTHSYLRVFGIMIVAFFLLEYSVDSGEQWAIIKYPIIWAVLLLILVFAVAIEIIAASLRNILYGGLDSHGQEVFEAAEAQKRKNRFSRIKKLFRWLLGSNPTGDDSEIVLDHNYDGIKELDNNLPPWWVYMFYATIIFAIVYLVRFEVFKEYNQIEEYEVAVAEAKIAIEEYKKTAKDLVDASSVELLTNASDISAGMTIFTTNCVVCHMADGGGGIGPNLTDHYWISGGGIKNVFNTISEGGRDGKGMVAWKSVLKPSEIAQVGSYLLTFEGTIPANPKVAEGEIWADPDASEIIDEVDSEVIDSTAVDSN